jgi:predicted ABC-type ATPase
LTRRRLLPRIVAVGFVPVLWITGPAGVGKSTVSWQLFTELAEAGVPVAFADGDQFCMCYPAPPGDPGRERIKAQNVGALIPRYRAAGAACVIVNGVVDPLAGVYSELMPAAELTVCRLRADPDEVARRFTGRYGSGEDLDELLRQTLGEATAMDTSDFAHVCVDTTGVAAAEVAMLVRESCGSWPGFGGSLVPAGPAPALGAAELPRPAETGPAGGDVLLLCGPTGVGKSTVGFEVYVRQVRAGRTAGYVDLDQIGFIRPGSDDDPGRHRLKAGNLAAMWRTYRAAGATRLIATGPIESDEVLRVYIQALPGARVTLGRLHADGPELTRRIMSRRDGGSWSQPGDPLRGQPAEFLQQKAHRAIADDDAFERAELGAVRVDTGGRTPAEAADLIARGLGWPNPS